MKNFTQLKKNLKNDFSGLTRVKVAVLGDTSTQLLCQALRGMGYEMGFNLEIFESDFNQVEQQVFDPSSELYAYRPEIILLFHSAHKLLTKYNTSLEDPVLFALSHLATIENMYATINQHLQSKIIYYNFNEIDDGVFGSFSNKLEASFLFQLRKLNFELMQFAARHTDFYICDTSSIQNTNGKRNFFNAPLYVSAEMVLAVDILPEVAKRTIDIIAALWGKFKKCIILDLDNTLWGGIIGDDGLENIQLGNLGIGKAFTEFQLWIKKLVRRGIIVCICSKNTEAIAREVFEKHPEMVLTLDDIAVFVVNWENKTDNIRQIQSILQIGFDAMVFLDDNPFERNMVRENIPEITVPELPDDPAEYLEHLYSLNLFETVSFSGEDIHRTRQYQVEAKRNNARISFTDEKDFLKSLNMTSVVEPFNKYNAPRVAQLSQRSNQFNVRTIRYTETDIEKLASSEDYFTFTFTLADKFGDNGLICVVILKKENDDSLFIDTWFMSCRILKRGAEDFVLNELINKARHNNYKRIIGEYIPTKKNIIVKDLYQTLGFKQTDKLWTLDVAGYAERKHFITNTKHILSGVK